MYRPSPSVERAPTRGWLPHEELERVDRELVRLAQGTAAVRLAVGEALVALTDDGGLRQLGFSSLGAYARERCERSGRWARDTRALARRLAELPLMRAGLRSGQLSWSMVELLARHASPDGEEELLSLAHGKTVRQMREHFRREAAQEGSARAGESSHAALSDGDGGVPGGDDEEREPVVQLTVTMTTEDAWALECTRMLLGHLGGGRDDTELIDSLLGEGMTTLLGVVPDAADELELSLGCAPFASEERAEQHREWLAQLAAWRDEAEQLCEGRIPPREPLGLAGGAAGEAGELARRVAGELDDLTMSAERGGQDEPTKLVAEPSELPTDEIELDRIILRLTRRLAQRDLRLGDELIRLCDANGWRRLGYASLGQYARERLGVSLSSAKAHMALARRARALEPLRAAVDAGEVGFEAAVLVGRVATPKTAAGWLARAQERTIKHLGEEVATAEIIARTTGDGDQPPPDDETQAVMMALESYVLSGRIFGGAGLGDEGQMSGDGEAVGAAGGSALRQMSGDGEAVGAAGGSALGQMSGDGEAVGAAGGLALGQMSGDGEAVGAAGGSALGQMSGDGEADGALRGTDAESRAARARLGAGKVTQRFRVARDVARAWHALAKVHARSGLAGSFVELLCVAVWQSWQHTLGSEVAYADLYARERYRCSSPVCFSRNQTPHHIRFRSRGGDDSPENLTGPCVDCHLDGIHGGNIRARGPASELRWELGREPVVEVRGRVLLSPRRKGSGDVAG